MRKNQDERRSDISVDQLIHTYRGEQTSPCRKHIDVLLNSMNEIELVVMEAAAEGLKKPRETEGKRNPYSCANTV